MTTDTTGEYNLPSNPADRKKIKDCIREVVDHLHQKAAQDESIKAIYERLKEEFEVPPKLAKKLATTLFKEEQKGNEFDKQVIEHESFEITFEVLFRGATTAADVEDESEED